MEEDERAGQGRRPTAATKKSSPEVEEERLPVVYIGGRLLIPVSATSQD